MSPDPYDDSLERSRDEIEAERADWQDYWDAIRKGEVERDTDRFEGINYTEEE